MKKYFFSFLLALSVTTCFAQLSPLVAINGWGLLNPYGIDRSSNRWESGRVNDVLEIDGATNSVLAIADMGGVWWLRSGGNWAVSLSNNWSSPDMFSLAKGINANHYFAGGVKAGTSVEGALYQTDFTGQAPLLLPWKEIPLPFVGTIYKILVQESTRKIILGTQNGIWWSYIPTRSDGSGYSFTRALFPAGCNMIVNDLAAGPDNSFIISFRGAGCPDSGPFLFKASFSPTNYLAMNPVAVSGLTPAELSTVSTVSIASCKNRKEFMYAVVANGTGGLLGVLKSGNGGTTFEKLNWRPSDDPGGRGGDSRNNCIAVHAANPDIVSFGWIRGPYISTNGGGSFNAMNMNLIHDDKAALEFSETNPNRLYICSDGGLASLNNINDPVQSSMDYTWSRRLANLQFVGPAALRQWWGRFDVGMSYSNIITVGGGLQDNNNVHMDGIDRPWKPLESLYDGGAHFYLGSGGMLWSNSGGGLRYRARNATTDIQIPIRNFSPGSDQRVNSLNGLFCKVIKPQKRNLAGQYMYAISTHSFGPDPAIAFNVIYGIFANADETDMHAEYLFTTTGANEVTSAISSYDGIEIFIGKRTSGRVIKMINRGGTLQYDQVNANGIPTGNDFNRHIARTIDVGSSSEAYALRNDEWRRGSVFFSPNGADWSDITGNLPPGIFYSMDLYKNACRNILFVITDDKVYACVNHSGIWTDISAGLPVRAHCSDIHVVQNPGCTTDIYLSTFGWSIWKTVLSN
ncbi:MAG TPA: hypothetical protein VGO58_06575 [Chitinophagaceae bacterium]|jgi:hypothetical protein|nr:hypothetical protein [Chitinophagaceae bacterium]